MLACMYGYVGLKELSYYSPFLAVVLFFFTLLADIFFVFYQLPNEFCLVLVVEMAAVVGLYL